MISFRKAVIEDADQLGYVHYVSWIETYKGLISDSFLSERNPEKSAKMFRRNNCERIFLAEDKNIVVGFISYNQANDEDLENYGAIYALYVLKAHQHLGIGRTLMDYAISDLMKLRFKGVSIWVLSTNLNAILFYERMGFIKDGKTKDEILGERVTEIRMIKKFI
ncbi:MAG: GNAT family N-acetyltransferase [Firmicutes bacterium]|nr:GNAT family N-acetyltransferase [Bacillota bacterium]